MERVFATSSSEMSIPSAISSTVGSRPSSCSSAEERFPFLLLDPLGERQLLLPGDQRVLADLAEVLVERSLVERGSFRRVQLHGGITPPGRYDAARYRTTRRTDGAERGGVPTSPAPQRITEPSRPQRISVSQGSASCASRS